MRTRKRSLSLLLCGALLFSLCPQTASAVSIPKTGAESSGLCEHHTEHNADCGYTEGIEGTPCNHRGLLYPCDRVRPQAYRGLLPGGKRVGQYATPSDAENRGPVNCTHECSEENGCIKKGLDCQHELSNE